MGLQVVFTIQPQFLTGVGGGSTPFFDTMPFFSRIRRSRSVVSVVFTRVFLLFLHRDGHVRTACRGAPLRACSRGEPKRDVQMARRCPVPMGLSPHGAELYSGVISRNENKNHECPVSYNLLSRFAAAHPDIRLLRCAWSAGRMRHRTRIAHGFGTTTTRANPLGDDHHHNDPGHGSRPARGQPGKCGSHDGNAWHQHHGSVRSPACPPIRGCAGPAGPQLCVARRLLDMAQQPV